jgi:hypothetical protein
MVKNEELEFEGKGGSIKGGLCKGGSIKGGSCKGGSRAGSGTMTAPCIMANESSNNKPHCS